MTTSTAAALPKVKFQSLAAVAQSVVPVTFGQVFLPGALPAGSGLIAGAIPMQVDVKTAHPDGSARHAILSGLLPALAANETQSLQLALGDTKPVVAGVWPAAFSVQVKITLAGVVYTAAAAQNDQRKWLDGAVVAESHSLMILQAEDGTKHPHLSARFAVRDYHGTGKLRADVTIENNWAYEPGPQNFTYDVEIAVAGQVVYSKAALTHLHHARWRKVFWAGTAPQVNVQLDAGYLIAMKVTPNYDQAVGIAQSALAGYGAQFITPREPMGLGLSSGYMPQTGADPDIGLLPEWNVAYLLSMDSRARDASLITADLAGSYSMHYRDQKTDRPVSLANHPYMTIVGHPTDTFNPDTKEYESFPPLAVDSPTPYVFDTPHQPSMAYLPYLVTGDYYYLEELQFWAMLDAFSSNPGYRENAKGLLAPDQVRGQAWSLRTLAQAAYITPNADPLKPDLNFIVNSNLDWYNSTYTNNPAANKLGVIVNGFALGYDGGVSLAPWQDDFFTAAVGYAAGLGFTKAEPLIAWKAKAAVGRMTSPGVCWIDAVKYTMQVVKSLPTDGNPNTTFFDTWEQVQRASRGDAFMDLPCGGPAMANIIIAQVGDMGGSPSFTMGYPANMQPALAYAVDAGIENAQRAWDLFQSRTIKPDYSIGGQFNVIPKNYTAAFIPPIVDPNDWEQIATEGVTVTVPPLTTVRYGADGFFIEHTTGADPVAVTASNAYFGSDPAPNVAKVLQQLIPSTEGKPMTHKLSVTSIAFKDQVLAFGTEAATSLLIEVLDPNGAVLGKTTTVPGDIGGIVFADLAAKHTIRASGVNSAGVMGAPALQDFVPQDNLPVVVPPADPVPTTAAFSLPSAVTFTLAAE